MEKGDIGIIELPDSDGREQYGTRPAITMADTDDDIALVIPFTTSMQALNFPNTLDIEPSKKNGLDERSVALLFQLRAIDEKLMQGTIGTMEESHMETIDETLRAILQL